MAKVVRIIAGVPRLQEETVTTVTIYDQTTVVGSGDLTAGTAITLPASETYKDSELEVYLNGQRVDVSMDFIYVGVNPRTQVEFLYDLEEGEKVRFRIDRQEV